MDKTIGLIYEISENPYFGSEVNKSEDRICEFPKPSEIDTLIKAIKSLGYIVRVIDGPKGLLEDLKEIKESCFLLFNKSIGRKGLERKITVPAICQMYELPLIGSSGYSMTLARHKFHTNRLLAGMGLPVPDACLIHDASKCDSIKKLCFPVIVKPNHESDSMGIGSKSICYDFNSAREQTIEILRCFKQPAIVEEFISGEEWKVALIGNGDTIGVFGAVSVYKNGQSLANTLQTRDDLIDKKLSYKLVADSAGFEKAKHISMLVHRAFGLQDYSRCDFRLNSKGEPICMEVSTHPDIDIGSSFTIASSASQLDIRLVVKNIIDASIARIY